MRKTIVPLALSLIALPGLSLAQSGQFLFVTGAGGTGPADAGVAGIAIQFTHSDPRDTAGPYQPEEEMDAICGDDNWISVYEEDPNGVPIAGTYNNECLNED